MGASRAPAGIPAASASTRPHLRRIGRGRSRSWRQNSSLPDASASEGAGAGAGGGAHQTKAETERRALPVRRHHRDERAPSSSAGRISAGGGKPMDFVNEQNRALSRSGRIR